MQYPKSNITINNALKSEYFHENSHYCLSASSPPFSPPGFQECGPAIEPNNSRGNGQYKQGCPVDPVVIEESSSATFSLHDDETDVGDVVTSILRLDGFKSGDVDQEAVSRYVCGQVASKTGATIVCHHSEEKSPLFSAKSHCEYSGPIFQVNGTKDQVNQAKELLKCQIGTSLCKFALPQNQDGLVERIDPEKKYDLVIDEDSQVLEAKLSFRNSESERLRLCCRREILKADGFHVKTFDCSLDLLAKLSGPLINKTLLDLSLRYGAQIDLPSPIVLGNVDSIQVLISGKEAAVDKTINDIEKISKLPTFNYYFNLSSDIIDYLLTCPRQYSTLFSICQDNGCVIQATAEGAVGVHGSSKSGLQSALKKITLLLHDIQSISIEADEINIEKLIPVQRLNSCRIEVKNHNTLSLTGIKQDIEESFDQLSQNAIKNVWISKVSWSMAVPDSVRDFVSGKKDGKLVKIMRETGVQICLSHMCREHLRIKLAGDSIFTVLSALSLLRGEVPAEITFHIRESQHKRLIGHGGKVIQQVMKKHAVYVKFLSSAEAWESAYGTKASDAQLLSAEKLDNVVVRTPAKNGDVLESVREEIMQMAEPIVLDEYCNGKENNDSNLSKRVSVKINRAGLLKLSGEGRKMMASLVDLGISLRRTWNDDRIAALKFTNQNASSAVLSNLSDEDRFALLDMGHSSNAPASPTLTASSGYSHHSTHTAITPEVFRHFNCALMTPPMSPRNLLDDLLACRRVHEHSMESFQLPSPPGAPGSGRSPRYNPTNLSTPPMSPELSFEEELAAAAKIMDRILFTDDTMMGPKSLHCQKDPVVITRRHSAGCASPIF